MTTRRYIPRQARALTHLATVAVLLAGGLGLTMIDRRDPDLARGAVGSVGGSVFRDLDMDGVLDAGEVGVANLWVRAVGQTVGADTTLNTRDDAVATYGPVRTDATGAWTIPNVTSDTLVRVELLGLDVNNDTVFDAGEAVLPAWLRPSRVGAGNGTSVQFAALNAVNVNYAVANPADYVSTTTPNLVTSVFAFGANTGVSAALPTTVNSLWTANAAAGFTATSTHSATGAVYGIAVQRTSQAVFSSAYLKRHTGFGPQGPGGIYRNGANWLDLNALPGFSGTGADPHPALAADYIVDGATYPLVGRRSLGDLDITEDDSTLLTVNLAAKQLVTIPIARRRRPPPLPSTPRRPPGRSASSRSRARAAPTASRPAWACGTGRSTWAVSARACRRGTSTPSTSRHAPGPVRSSRCP